MWHEHIRMSASHHARFISMPTLYERRKWMSTYLLRKVVLHCSKVSVRYETQLIFSTWLRDRAPSINLLPYKPVSDSKQSPGRQNHALGNDARVSVRCAVDNSANAFISRG